MNQDAKSRAWFLLVATLMSAAPDAAAQSGVTFTKDVAPIIFEHCSPCHRPGEIGPFSLLSYQDVKPLATTIARVTRTGVMPPWKPEPGYGKFVGDRRLSEKEIVTIQQWNDSGATEGNPSDLPPIPRLIDGWRLGRPDLVVGMTEPYTLSPDGPDVFRNFVIPIPLQQTRYVRGIEFRPGNLGVVHHANLRLDRTRSSRLMDAADPSPGYDGLTATTAIFPDGHFLGWTPGQLPPPLANGMAWRLEPDTDLVVQLHMRPGDKPEAVQSSVGFFFTRQPPEREPVMIRLGRQNIDIPPNQRQYLVEDSYTLPVGVDVFSVQPHAHFRAREVRGVATLPDGTKQWLIYVKDWDFNWQDVYRYAEPLMLPKGTILSMQWTYDNSADNPRNPDRPPKHVRWGQNSTDEMGDLWIQVRPRTAADHDLLNADYGRKALAEDAVGYETLLESDGDDKDLHDNAALIYLSLGDPDRAIAHLAESVRIGPQSATAHYNLGTALVARGRLDDALEHFRLALQMKPDYVRAHINLGAVLRSQQKLNEAIGHFHQVLQIEPRNADAHTNLAGVLAVQDKPREAIAHYRLALQENPAAVAALTELAWILATCADPDIRKPDEAVRLAERAATLTKRQNVSALDALAASYAASRQFDRAVSSAEAALRLLEAAGPDPFADRVRERLGLYRQRKAFLQTRHFVIG